VAELILYLILLLVTAALLARQFVVGVSGCIGAGCRAAALARLSDAAALAREQRVMQLGFVAFSLAVALGVAAVAIAVGRRRQRSRPSEATTPVERPA
jgi:hypothetical protein